VPESLADLPYNPRSPQATQSVEETLLERVQLRLSSMFTSEMVVAATHLDSMIDAVLLELKAEVWEDKVAESTYTYRVPVPDTWFQHLRKSLGLKHRSKHLTGSVTLCKRARFPDAPASYPDRLGRPVYLETAAETWPEPQL
jgi:hypothetical protein